jgi:DeoR/GlpR family transcriptional regulator of sugar metabolism
VPTETLEGNLVSPAARSMIPEQRHQEILRLLRQEGILSVRNLTAYMNVSHMTVRRDITALEASGQVTSVHGGVRLAEWNSQEPPRELEFRAQPGLPREKAIAELAAQSIEDDMVVFLDAGTTCQAVVPFLAARQHLTVVTNDFYIVTSLFDYPNIETIHTGGAVDPTSASSYGRLAAEMLKFVNIDLSFLSTGTWNISRGLMASSVDKVEVKRAALEASSSRFLLADSTKFGTVSRFNVVPLERLDAVVTDDQLPLDIQDNIRELGVGVRLATFSKAAQT